MDKAGLFFPEGISNIEFDDKELQRFVDFIYHPIIGLFYRNRFRWVNNFLPPHCEMALEIGFGPGLFIPTLAGKCRHLYGIDIHPEINKIKGVLNRSGVNNLSLLNADIYAMPFRDRFFDLIVCQSILEHLTQLDKAVAELARVLKDDGRIIMAFPVKNRLTKALFSFLKLDDDKIHPSGHSQILNSAVKKLALERSFFYPRVLGLENSLYFVGSFRKKYEKEDRKRTF